MCVENRDGEDFAGVFETGAPFWIYERRNVANMGVMRCTN